MSQFFCTKSLVSVSIRIELLLVCTPNLLCLLLQPEELLRITTESIRISTGMHQLTKNHSIDHKSIGLLVWILVVSKGSRVPIPVRSFTGTNKLYCYEIKMYLRLTIRRILGGFVVEEGKSESDTLLPISFFFARKIELPSTRLPKMGRYYLRIGAYVSYIDIGFVCQRVYVWHLFLG
jgi:hypothetical protein